MYSNYYYNYYSCTFWVASSLWNALIVSRLGQKHQLKNCKDNGDNDIPVVVDEDDDGGD